MRARSAFAALGLSAGAAAAAAAALWLRRGGSPREHVDLYFADGSMVSFVPGSSEGDRLLPIARRVLAAARG
jgi:acetyl esterase/lipase